MIQHKSLTFSFQTIFFTSFGFIFTKQSENITHSSAVNHKAKVADHRG